MDMNNKDKKINITHEDLIKIYKRVKFIDEPDCPFPQVDKFDNLLDFCNSIKDSEITPYELKNKHNLKPRQYNFYINAGIYLNLLEQKDGPKLTVLGEILFNLDERTRNLIIIELILMHKPFYAVFNRYILTGHIPLRDEIYDIIKDMNLHNINSEVTLRRRSQSMRQWIIWIISISEYKYYSILKYKK